VSDLRIIKKDEVHLKILSEPSIAQELSEYFTFVVPEAKHSPAFKNKIWDGKIRLFKLNSRTLYLGLHQNVKQFAATRDYGITYDTPDDFKQEEPDQDTLNRFIEQLKLPLTVRPYQFEAFQYGIKNKRALLVSPTGSGKSLIIYLLSQYHTEKRCLIIVPTTGLVHQMKSDFVSYGCDEDNIHAIFSGQQKQTKKKFVVSTWQSIYELEQEWFDQFDCIIGDEAHLFKATSLVGIMEKTIRCPYKFGLTGTLDGSKTNKLVLEGLFGPMKQVTRTSELIEDKTLSNFKIKALVLSHPEDSRLLFRPTKKKKPSYEEEMNFICDSKERNKFILNLTSSMKGNTLLLFNFVNHGKVLYEAIKKINSDKKVFLVYGGVEGEEREEIRKFTEDNSDVIIVASYKTFSTGVNIKNLHNIVFCSPSKSKIRVFQSIGRALRKSETKDVAVLYDIADDLSWKSRKNFTLKHFYERVQMYTQEKFQYKIFNIPLKGKT
jgi:superfamily II DNA or RNA helicase